MKIWGWIRGAWAVVLALALAGCAEEGTGPGEPAFVKVALTDAPAEVISAAEVWISRVYVVPGGDSAKAVVLFNDPSNPRRYNLLDLRGGVSADLTDTVRVESGVYNQLRLVVDSARVTLAEGRTFQDGSTSKTLFVPSGSQSGIKVQLAEPIDAGEGQVTIVLVDFDVERNFVIQGNVDSPAGIRGILFTPTLVERSRQRAAAP
ncbi:MAG: DUF4382 domain-containing protein [Gemmatimonadetes bacterium]|nr:DUF4382 domain-containing protein [Gemmatimonadota bacterium]